MGQDFISLFAISRAGNFNPPIIDESDAIYNDTTLYLLSRYDGQIGYLRSHFYLQ